LSFRNFGNKGGDITKKQKYTLTENAISAILAILISIPICIGVYRSHGQETPRTAPEPVPSEVVYVVPREVVEPATEEPTEEVIDLGEFRIMAYCACPVCCGEWSDGITYTGTVATEGRTIAVDPDVIPLGSVVEINGSEYVAEDVGGAIKGNRLDIFFSDHNDALVWGVQDIEVYLVEEASNE